VLHVRHGSVLDFNSGVSDSSFISEQGINTVKNSFLATAEK